MPTVSIVQRILPHYRLGFFERLHAMLADRGIDLRLCYGQELPGTRPGSEEFPRAWTTRLENRYFVGRTGRTSVWSPCLRALAKSDLVITEHAARLLINYPLIALSRVGGPRLAMWGHGRNLQAATRSGFSDTVRERLAQGAHWWFAYTGMSARIVADIGFPSERITVVNNAIDTAALGEAVARTSAPERAALRAQLELPERGVGIFCGRLVAEKRLDLVREACDIVHARRPDFRLIIVGDGPCEAEVRQMAADRPWLRFVGPKFGAALAPYLAVSDFMLMPGLVGLVIVDSFASGLPLITTDHGGHSPEIEYLRHGENALMTSQDPEALADGIVGLVDSREQLQTLRAGCAAGAREYTLERMVERFSDGVSAALA